MHRSSYASTTSHAPRAGFPSCVCWARRACVAPFSHRSASQRKLTCVVSRRTIGLANVTVEVAEQVSNGHPVNVDCPKGYQADAQSSMMCYSPASASLNSGRGAVIVILICFSLVLMLGAAWTRRIHGQKSASPRACREIPVQPYFISTYMQLGA